MEEEMTQEMMDEIAQMQEEQAEEGSENQMELAREMEEAWGSPEPEEKMNQHSFLHKAVFESNDPLKTTFLTSQEVGRPDFPIRFLQSIELVAKQQLDDICKLVNVENMIADYFKSKINNISKSGMSYEGFSMKLNVTKAIDTTKKRIREGNIENLKGGSKR